MTTFQYDISEAQSSLFSQFQLPAMHVPVRLNGVPISVINMTADGRADLALTDETVEKLRSGKARIDPYLLITGSCRSERKAELISLDING